MATPFSYIQVQFSPVQSYIEQISLFQLSPAQSSSVQSSLLLSRIVESNPSWSILASLI